MLILRIFQNNLKIDKCPIEKKDRRTQGKEKDRNLYKKAKRSIEEYLERKLNKI